MPNPPGTARPAKARSGAHAAPPTTLLYLMKQVELAVRAELDDLARPAGLTALQYTALTVLERHPDLTAAHLARHSFVTGQTMSDMVTALLDRGLIERHRDPVDRRRLVIALTPAGRRLLDRLRPQVAALETRMLAPLSHAQGAELRHLLEMCRQALRDAQGATEPPAHDQGRNGSKKLPAK
jgi:DNA-binding MarR family transcriptional regulator